ncbi:hypothetical protein ACQCVP_17425 [Rossellomorea vietnamensis]|uniref:hypothetical protein n=1 Tax=Rossellomorea vietnamensis TaxID=218284 RepID=UPI003CF49230
MNAKQVISPLQFSGFLLRFTILQLKNIYDYRNAVARVVLSALPLLLSAGLLDLSAKNIFYRRFLQFIGGNYTFIGKPAILLAPRKFFFISRKK